MTTENLTENDAIQYNVHHVPRKLLVTADALSHSPIPHDAAVELQPDEDEFYVSVVQSHWPVSMTCHAKLKAATVQDRN